LRQSRTLPDGALQAPQEGRLIFDADVRQDEVGVSVSTIRRDLDYLDSQGFVRRIHCWGGMVNATARKISIG
jgi:predicted DNA-binding transcriptional regulator YafY